MKLPQEGAFFFFFCFNSQKLYCLLSFPCFHPLPRRQSSADGGPGRAGASAARPLPPARPPSALERPPLRPPPPPSPRQHDSGNSGHGESRAPRQPLPTAPGGVLRQAAPQGDDDPRPSSAPAEERERRCLSTAEYGGEDGQYGPPGREAPRPPAGESSLVPPPGRSLELDGAEARNAA